MPQPLGLAAADELIDDDLRAVGEIAELRLPHDQRVGVLQRVPQLKPEDSKLAERRVGDGEELVGPAVAVHVAQGHEPLAGVLIVDQRVAVRERASLHVLPGEAHVVTLVEQGAESERLGHRPIQTLARLNHLSPGVVNALDDPVRGERLRDRRGRHAHLLEDVHLHARLPDARELVGALETLPVRGEPVPGLGPVILRVLKVLIEFPEDLLVHLRDLLAGQRALGDELIAVLLVSRSVRLDLLVHQRLREHRLVDFVVPVLAVADDVHDDVAPELLPPLGGELHHASDGLDVVAVDVEHRRVDALGHVGAVGARSRVLRVGGERHLVVHHDVNGTADGVLGQLGHVQGLVHDPLAAEGAVAVEQHGHVFLSVAVVFVKLLGARFADDDGVHRLEVARVGDQGEVDATAAERGSVVAGTQVVLDVAGAGVGGPSFRHVARGFGTRLELVEDGLHGFADNVREDVEAPAVGHADRDGLHAELGSLVDGLLEPRDHGLASLEAEPLGGGVLVREEILKHVSPRESVQEHLLAGFAVLRALLLLDLLSEPVALVPVRDVHVLVADVPAVRVAEAIQDLPKRLHRVVFAEETLHLPRAEEELAIEVRLREAVQRRVQLDGNFSNLEAERIEAGHEVPVHLVRPDEEQEPHGLLDALAGRRVGGGEGHGRRAGLRGDVHLAQFRAGHAGICRRGGETGTLR